ncbi:MAG: hypothetical protein VB957_10705 [Pseudomonadales bacterium]
MDSNIALSVGGSGGSSLTFGFLGGATSWGAMGSISFEPNEALPAVPASNSRDSSFLRIASGVCGKSFAGVVGRFLTTTGFTAGL